MSYAASFFASHFDERRRAYHVSPTGTVLSSELRPDEAEIAGVLASETADAHLRNRLTLKQAELSSDASVATYLWGRVHQAGQLPDSHLQWACEVALRASEPQKVIDLMEGRLRQDPPLHHGYVQASLFNGDQFPQNGIFARLAAAYRAVGRNVDAQRAHTEASQRRLPNPRPTTRGGGFF